MLILSPFHSYIVNGILDMLNLADPVNFPAELQTTAPEIWDVMAMRIASDWNTRAARQVLPFVGREMVRFCREARRPYASADYAVREVAEDAARWHR